MDNLEKYAIVTLQSYTYRVLQEIAKKLTLPANVKKSCLVHMIHTRMKTRGKSIIADAKRGRQKKNQESKQPEGMGRQSDEISTSGHHRSPAISATSKRSSRRKHSFVRSSPILRRSMQNYSKSATNVHHSSAMANAPTTRPDPQNTPCYMVLRNRRIPVYSDTAVKNTQTFDSNDRATDLPEKQNGQEKSNRGLQIVNRNNRSNLKNQTPYKVQTKPPVQKHESSILSGNGSSRNSLPRKHTSINTCRNHGDVIESVDVIQNALVEPQSLKSCLVHMIHTRMKTRGKSIIADAKRGRQKKNQESKQPEGMGRQKITSEQVRTRRESIDELPTTKAEQLPRILKVFKLIPEQASNVDCSQGLQTSNFLTNQPFCQISTGTVTQCVYSMPTVAPTMLNEDFIIENNIDASAGNYPALAEDFFISGPSYIPMEATGATQNTDQNESDSMTAPLDRLTSQVELDDASEWIGRDGDYMERMGLDSNVQCILCEWSGPKCYLEHHIRTEHPTNIRKVSKLEWKVTFSLSALLASGLWHFEVIEGYNTLYVVSASAVQGTFRATVTTLSPEMAATPNCGTVTIYNAATGEPRSWSGCIRPFTQTLPHQFTVGCGLIVHLHTLDVLPRIDGENGQQNSCIITLFVKI